MKSLSVFAKELRELEPPPPPDYCGGVRLGGIVGLGLDRAATLLETWVKEIDKRIVEEGCRTGPTWGWIREHFLGTLPSPFDREEVSDE